MAVRPCRRNSEFRGKKDTDEHSSTQDKHAETACRELREEENAPEVIVIKDDDDTSSSDDPDAVGVDDLQFGRRSQPLRYSRATRYHMLLEIALERKRQRQESTSSSSKPLATDNAKSRPRAKGRRKGKKDGGENCCALLFGKDPFASSSDESDGEWDPTAVYGAAARRRLKGRYSETESETSSNTSEGENGNGKEEGREAEAAGERDTKQKGNCENRGKREGKTSDAAKPSARKHENTNAEESQGGESLEDKKIDEQSVNNSLEKLGEEKSSSKQPTAAETTDTLPSVTSNIRSDAAARRRRQALAEPAGNTSKSLPRRRR